MALLVALPLRLYVPTDDDGVLVVLPTLEECTKEYDNTKVSVPFTSVAFSSSLALGCDLFEF
jgi:hypothetical protein